MQTSQNHVPSPITCRIHADHGVFVTTWRGAVSDDDHIRFYLDLFETPAWRPGLHEIVDLRLADMAGVTPGGLRRLWGIVESRFADLDIEFKTAVISGSDLSFGLARLYPMVSDGSPQSVRVFQTLTPALEWVGGAPDLLG